MRKCNVRSTTEAYKIQKAFWVLKNFKTQEPEEFFEMVKKYKDAETK